MYITEPYNRFVCLDEETIETSEVENYINFPIKCEVNIINWWQENANQFPRLYKFFKKISTIPATSASSERDFSHAGNVITDKRTLLLPENLNDLIIAKSVL